MPVDYAAEYTRLHRNQKYFKGGSMMPHVDDIGHLVREHHAESLLDYGCGKGEQYLKSRVHEAWGVEMPRLYDIGVPAYSARPGGKFDGVICTDMMEHIAEPDVPALLTEIIGLAGKFVFFAISCAPAVSKKSKRLSDGRNLHLTVRPPEWWDDQIKAANVDGIDVHVRYMDL